VELAQYTARLPLVDHTSTLSPPARITRPILPTSNVRSCLGCCTAHAGRQVCPAVGVTVILRVGSFDGLFWAGPPRSYSDGRRPGDSYWCRHGVMRLDWSADPNQVPEFCAGPVTSSAIGGWASRMGVCSSAAARGIWICASRSRQCSPVLGEGR